MKISEDLFPVFDFKKSVIRLGKEKSVFRLVQRKDPYVVISSPSASYILSQFTGQLKLKDIITKLSNQFNVPYEILLADIQELITPLVKQELLLLADKLTNCADSLSLQVMASHLRGNLHIDLTEICNEKCVHCLADKDGKTLSTAIVLKTLKEAALAGMTEVSFSGGEALLHPDFWQIAYCAKQYGFAITLFSNGLNIDDECADKIADLHVETVRLSVYSMDENLHDKITQVKGSLRKTLSAAKRLKNRQVPVFINCPIMKDTFESAKDVWNYAKNEGFEYNLDPCIQPTRDGRASNDDIKLSAEQFKTITEIMFPGEMGHNVEPNRLICAAGSGQNFYINAKGQVTLCPTMNQFIGNINETSFLTVLEQDNLTPKCAAITIDNLEKCKDCPVRKACQRCHARALRDTGKLNGCSPEDFAHAVARKEIMQKRGVWKN